MALVTAGLVIQGTGRSAFVAPGYVTALNSAEFQDAIALYPLKGGLTDAQFDRIVAWHTRPQAVDAAVAALPSQIPLTVQGASEDFIQNTMGGVVSNTNAVGAQLSNITAQYRDQIKTHVTTEANRVIAAN